jgi:UrcA family protein
MTKTFFAAAALLALASPAWADQTPGKTVSYGDLDLSTAAGQAELSGRVQSAVREACGPIDSSDPRGLRHRNQCRQQRLSEARTAATGAIARYQARGAERLAGR